MNDLLAAAGVLAALGLLFIFVRAATSRWTWSPEVRRKIVHVGMGLVTAPFPWIFTSTLVVWLLAAAAIAALAAVRLVPAVRQRFAFVLHDVDRQSWGDYCLPLSVALLFTLAHETPLFYLIPILILSLADALGALIGIRYGSVHYRTDDGAKSAEGSVAFFLVAFLATHVPLLLYSDIGRLECLLVGFVLGFIVMLTEAIAWRGLDNLFVPMAAYACIARFIHLDAEHLVVRLLVLVLIVAALRWWSGRTHLTGSAATAAALIMYVTWAAGTWHWLIAPLALLVGYTFLCPEGASTRKVHKVEAIAAIGGVGLIWQALSHLLGTVTAIYPFGVAYGVQLSLIALAFFCERRRHIPRLRAAAYGWLVGFAFISIPYFIVWRENIHVVGLAGTAGILLALAVAAFLAWQPHMEACPVDSPRWLRQGFLAGLASLVSFVIINWLEPWTNTI